jgi:hypothetical protein
MLFPRYDESFQNIMRLGRGHLSGFRQVLNFIFQILHPGFGFSSDILFSDVTFNISSIDKLYY